MQMGNMGNMGGLMNAGGHLGALRNLGISEVSASMRVLCGCDVRLLVVIDSLKS